MESDIDKPRRPSPSLALSLLPICYTLVLVLLEYVRLPLTLPNARISLTALYGLVVSVPPAVWAIVSKRPRTWPVALMIVATILKRSG